MIPPRSMPTVAAAFACLAFVAWMYASRPAQSPLYASAPQAAIVGAR